MKHFKFILPFIFILFACSPDSEDTSEDTTENTRLELTFLNENSVSLENIEVRLFASQEDYENDTSVIETLTTDTNGKVIFNNLQPITYYWRITANCYVDGFTYSTPTPLTNNTLNTFSSTLNNHGSLEIINNTSYDQYIEYVGPKNGSILVNAFDRATINNLTSGNYNIGITTIDSPINWPSPAGPITIECGSEEQLRIN